MTLNAADRRSYALSLLRLASGLVILSYGTPKSLRFPFVESVPPTFSLPWIAGVFELVLGFLLLIGFRTRAAAFVLSGVMAFAYFLRHAPQSVFPAQNGGVAAILFCFIFLYIAAAGPGPFSIDEGWKRTSPQG